LNGKKAPVARTTGVDGKFGPDVQLAGTQVGDGEALGVPDAVAVAVGVAVGVTVAVGVAVGVTVAVAVGVGLEVTQVLVDAMML
jgi:hypothetical protein